MPINYNDPMLYVLILLAVGVTFMMYRKTSKWGTDSWREVITKAPVPMIGLAAAFGVYEFGLIFYPWWVAAISAASFEVVYISLGWQVLHTKEQQEEARRVSLFAVGVSIIYNSLVGFFHLSGIDVKTLHIGWLAILALVHGVPLAVVAYNYSKLVLHNNTTEGIVVDAPPAEPLVTQAQLAELLARLLGQNGSTLPPAHPQNLLTDDSALYPLINTLKTQGKMPSEIATMMGPGWDAKRVKDVIKNGPRA